MKFRHSNSSQAFELKDSKLETLCVHFLKFPRNRQSQQPLDIQIWLKQQLEATTSFKAIIAFHGY